VLKFLDLRVSGAGRRQRDRNKNVIAVILHVLAEILQGNKEGRVRIQETNPLELVDPDHVADNVTRGDAPLGGERPPQQKFNRCCVHAGDEYRFIIKICRFNPEHHIHMGFVKIDAGAENVQGVLNQFPVK